VPPLLTWQIFQIIVDYLSPIVIACVLNWSHGHWMLIDVLNSIISYSLKLKKDNAPLAYFESLMEDEPSLVEKLVLLTSNIRTEVCSELYSFLSFLRTYEEKKHTTWFFNVRS
jgi:hypothetical protein